MVLLRRVIGDALRARRQAQHRTLREVSTAANVSLGYLSEIERGQKEASSELLAAICEALGAALSEVLRDVSDALAATNDDDRGVLVPAGVGASDDGAAATETPATAPTQAPEARISTQPKASIADGKLSVAVHHDGPLKTTLRVTRERERVYA
jgi:transcriptional regulator with XRE-family HTH domain